LIIVNAVQSYPKSIHEVLEGLERSEAGLVFSS
jgi:hypothetical protein